MPERTENHEDSQQPDSRSDKSMRLFRPSRPKGVALPSILKRFQRTKHYGATPVTSQRVIAKNNQEKFKDFGSKLKQKNSQNLRKLEMPAGKRKASWEKVEMTLPNGEQDSGSARDHSDLDSLRQLLNSMPSSRPSQSQPAENKPAPAAARSIPTASQSTPAAQPVQVSKPRWKKPDASTRRYSRVEEVSPVRQEPGQIPGPQPQASRVPGSPQAAQDRPLIQRQIEKSADPTPAAEKEPKVEKEKPLPQEPVEKIQRQVSPELQTGDKIQRKPQAAEKPQRQESLEAQAAGKPSVEPLRDKLPDDFPLKRPVPRAKEDPGTVEVRRQPLQESSAKSEPQKIEDSGSFVKSGIAPETAPDNRKQVFTSPATSEDKKIPSASEFKENREEIRKNQQPSRINLFSNKKRSAETAVQRMLEKSPQESRPFRQASEKPQMPLVSKQVLKGREQIFRQEEPISPARQDVPQKDQAAAKPLQSPLVQRPIRLNLWKKSVIREEAAPSITTKEPLSRIQKAEKPLLQQKLARRSLVQRTLSSRRTSAQTLVLRKPAGQSPAASLTEKPVFEEKKTSLPAAQVSRPVVQRKPSELTKETAPESLDSLLLPQRSPLQKRQKSPTLLQRAMLKSDKKARASLQRMLVEKRSLPAHQTSEMPVRRAVQPASIKEQPLKTVKPATDLKAPVFAPAARMLQKQTTIQRLLEHQKEKTGGRSPALLLKRRPQTAESKSVLSGAQAPLRQEKSVQSTGKPLVQRMLETSPQKPPRLVLKQKAVRQEETPVSHIAAGTGILAAGQQTGQLVQRIQARGGSKTRKLSGQSSQGQSKGEEVLRQHLRQAFPDKKELPVVNTLRQNSTDGNLVQRAVADPQSANTGPGADNDLVMSRQNELPQDVQQESSAPVEDVSWSLDPEAGMDKEKTPDLQSLARQIFPIVKRLLALEKERSTGRSF